MTDYTTLAALAGVGVIGSRMAHELTHAAAAKLLRAELRDVSVLGGQVAYAVHADRSRWIDRGIGLAPMLVGVMFGAVVLAYYGRPSARPIWAVAAMVWVLYSLPSPEDVWGCSFGEAVEESRLPLPLVQLAIVTGLLVAGELLWHWVAGPPDAPFDPFLGLMAPAIKIGAAVGGGYIIGESLSRRDLDRRVD
jgi:hypothetical protein